MKLHAETIPVKGFNRAIIYDLHRKVFYAVPNGLVDFLKAIDGKSYIDIIRGYSRQTKKILDEYMNFLLEKEIVFMTESKYIDMFSELSLEWDYPGLLQRTTIDYSGAYPIERFLAVLLELDRMGVKIINIRLLTDIPMLFMNDIMGVVHESGFNQVNFFINAHSDFTLGRFNQIITNDMRVKKIFIHNTGEDAVRRSDLGYDIIATAGDFEGKDSLAYNRFVVDISIFMQAQRHNVFFNRYLYIDSGGVMKNALRGQRTIGNIFEKKSLKQIFSNSQYTELFFSRKDDIENCAVCEFRYMCFSNRNLEKMPNGRWRIVEKDECDYNPYISKWKYEKKFYSITDVGSFSDRGKFVLDRAKIKEINQDLWGY